MPCAELQPWRTDHEKRKASNTGASHQVHRYTWDEQQEETGASPWLGPCSPGCQQLAKNRSGVRNKIFQGVDIFYLVIFRLRTTKMHSGFPNPVGFLWVLLYHIKVLEIVQTKLLSISPSPCIFFWPPANDWSALHSLNSNYRTYILTKGMQKNIITSKNLEYE